MIVKMLTTAVECSASQATPGVMTSHALSIRRPVVSPPLSSTTAGGAGESKLDTGKRAAAAAPQKKKQTLPGEVPLPDVIRGGESLSRFTGETSRFLFVYFPRFFNGAIGGSAVCHCRSYLSVYPARGCSASAREPRRSS